ncbi:MAG TPA: hypothetical protein VMF03_02175, partial [Steroidobacteraceae bacterium]|nr:hypothetical protein [Steroidobacteraceae bacterium]
QAIRTLLTGWPPHRFAQLAWGLGIGLGIGLVLAIGSYALYGHRNQGDLFVAVLCLLAGPLAASFGGIMSQRGKSLWLQGGFGREALFAELESRSWRLVLLACGFCIALAASWFLVTGGSFPPLAWRAAVLVTPLASGPLFTYAQLQLVRGRRLPDLLVIGVVIALWLVEGLNLMAVGAPALVPVLLALQIILVPLLRTLALRRWQRVDWLIHKSVRNPLGLA